MPRSLRIQSTAKPKSNLPSFMVFQRLSICQDCAAPLEMVSITLRMSRPAFCAKARPSETPCTVTATHDLVDHLGELAGARGADQRAPCGRSCRSPAWRLSKGAWSPPTITVSAPFSAPAWPPETGASRKSKPLALAAA